MRTRTVRLALLAGALALAAGCGAQVNSGTPGSGGGPAGGTGGSGTGATGSGGSGGGGLGGAGVVTGSGGAGSPACTALAPLTQRLWRLSAHQYANATKDLLGLSSAPVLTETSADGNMNNTFFSGVNLGISPAFLDSGLFTTAEAIMAQIAPRITQLAACMPTETTAAGQRTCAQRFAQTFGAKVFRRPLDPTEVTSLIDGVPAAGATPASPGPFTVGAMQDFNTGISLMIESMILSPSFLYRSELGPTTLAAGAAGTLTPLEIATQLGFLFLDSTPDDALLAAANAAGTMNLGTPTGLMAQVTRLLALPAVKTNLTNVTTNWFNLGQLAQSANKDTTLLAPLTVATDRDQAAIVGELLVSAQQFVTDTLWTNATGKVTDLLSSPKLFVNRRLATLYGVPFTGATPTTFVSSMRPAGQPSAGMLSQPAFLWAISDPAAASIVHRGKFIYDNVVCSSPLTPIDLTTPNALAVIAMGDSEVTKSDARMTHLPCSGCHQQMDPYPRALQNFGPIGNYRINDEVGRPVDPSVTFIPPSPLAPTAPVMVSGPVALAQAIVSSGRLSGCAIQKMTSFAIGTAITDYNTCELQTLRTQFDQSNGTLPSLFTQVALANFVRARVGGAK